MTNWFFAVAVGYLLGSIPIGFLFGRLRSIDVRRYGSGATGGTNVLRTLGWGPAVGTGLGDLFKGMLAAYLGYLLAGQPGYALGGLAAVVGHCYPVWLRFRGGKGVATGGGALLLMHPVAFTVGLASGLLTIIATRYVSLGSLVAVLIACGAVWLYGAPMPDKLLASGAFVLIYLRHWENMKRIASGVEHRYGQKSRPHSTADCSPDWSDMG